MRAAQFAIWQCSRHVGIVLMGENAARERGVRGGGTPVVVVVLHCLFEQTLFWTRIAVMTR